MNPQATAGRIVHYYLQGGQHRAAIVAADTAPDGTACLTVFFDTGPSVVFGVKYSENPMSACWSWMPYQHEKAKTERGNESESAEPEADSRDGEAGDVPVPAGSVDAGPSVSDDPVGEPAGEPDEVASGPTQETAVVDGEEPDQGEPVSPPEPR